MTKLGADNGVTSNPFAGPKVVDSDGWSMKREGVDAIRDMLGGFRILCCSDFALTLQGTTKEGAYCDNNFRM